MSLEAEFDMVRVGWDCPACHCHHTSLVHRHVIGRHDLYEACPNRWDRIITIYTSECEPCTVCGGVIDPDDGSSHSTETGWCHEACCASCVGGLTGHPQ